MGLSNLRYSLREAFRHFHRNFGTCLGAIITIFLSLFMIGMFVLGSALISGLVGNVEDRVTIQAFLSDDANQDDVNALQSKIESWDNVESVTYKSKDEALEEYRETMSNRDADDAVAALDGENPVPASLVIKLDDPEQVESVASKLTQDSDFQSVCDDPDNVSSSVLYGRETVERLFSVTYYVRIATIALVVLLTFVSFVFINNTIRLAISARRREIAIERLVGASNSFIRGPFVAEAALEALFGAVLAIVTLNAATNAVLPRISNALSFLSFEIPHNVVVSTYVILIVVGVLLGLLGSAIAMRRYLRV
ncbi:MAG: permease-like cell division protein FtsX [Atopobiaceae bacterium]|jgi:cell division transport system permease protein|nr:permease-like cell division protein FtsX [Olegusella sp.]MCI1933760.1 permease-like cell division protein FtsX [Atopobiaceae bacterium]